MKIEVPQVPCHSDKNVRHGSSYDNTNVPLCPLEEAKELNLDNDQVLFGSQVCQGIIVGSLTDNPTSGNLVGFNSDPLRPVSLSTSISQPICNTSEDFASHDGIHNNYELNPRYGHLWI